MTFSTAAINPVHFLTGLLDDPQTVDSQKVAACDALEQIGDPFAVPTLIHCLTVNHSNLRYAAQDALLVMKPQSVTALIGAIEASETGSQELYYLAWAAKKLADPALIPSLKNALVRNTVHILPNPIVEALKACGWTPSTLEEKFYHALYTDGAGLVDLGPEAVPLILPLLEDSQFHDFAIVALGKIGDPSALPNLYALMDQKNAPRTSIIRAIANIVAPKKSEPIEEQEPELEPERMSSPADDFEERPAIPESNAVRFVTCDTNWDPSRLEGQQKIAELLAAGWHIETMTEGNIDSCQFVTVLLINPTNIGTKHAEAASSE